MVDQAVTYVDIESAIRSWARDAGLADRRVFFGVRDDAPFPQIIVRRIAGPDDACLIQFDVWHKVKSGAAQLAADLCSELSALSRYTADGTVLKGAGAPLSRWLPDPESDLPRYVVDVTITASSLS